ncbi:MAG: QueT transporter family protein [Actinomycetia bacterium]|nr:QueT transporter family protein [Actinomycetes bacterium]
MTKQDRGKNSRFIARCGLIAALYAALSLLAMVVLQTFSWGPVQLRISEAACVLALFTPAAIPGLALGCVLANSLGMAINGTGPLGLLDVVFGSLATGLGSLWMWRFRHIRPLALAGPVLANAAIVPAYLPLMLAAFGFYTIPFTNISLSDSWPAMYLFGILCIGLGQAIVLYALGWPLAKALDKSRLTERLADDD